MIGKDIEARLDRSLQKQVQAPRLDRRFDAAVWARIEEEEAKAHVAVSASPSRAVQASRWLAITNILGVAVTLGVVLYFAVGAFGGIEPRPLALALDVPVPAISGDAVQRVVAALGQVLGIVALAFGLSFTSLGRRLRTTFS